jgi:uncharacterized protein YpmB
MKEKIPLIHLIHLIILLSLIFIGVAIIFCDSVKKANMREEQMLTEKYEEGYLDACKDFYKGKLKYDLIENNDGSKTWQKIK